MGEPIYVEISIDCGVEEIWRLTQEPAIHERWDLRFSSIEYEPKLAPADPQRFRYSRRIAPGLWVRGAGETTGERRTDDGSGASALRFWSNQRRSLIRQGSGYWRYVPDAGAVRFLTRYDYEVRWGAIGQILDRLLFRRILGWATAWSFDAARIWIEEGVEVGGPLRTLLRRTRGGSGRRLAPRASRCLREPFAS